MLVWLLPPAVQAQQPGQQWIRSAGGSGIPGSTSGNPAPDVISDMVVEPNGDIITCGSVSYNPAFGNTTFSPPNSNYGNVDFFIAKYNSCGDLLWARVGGGPQGDGIRAVETDSAGNIYALLFMPLSNSPGYIKTPTLDTSFLDSRLFFLRFTPDGEITRIVRYNQLSAFTSSFEMLSNGLLQGLYYNSASPDTVGNFTFKPYSKYFVRFNTDGDMVDVKLIDTISNAGADSKFTVDDNDNTYIGVNTYMQTQMTILDTVLTNFPLVGGIVVRADKDLHITKAIACYKYGALFNMNYHKGYLYTSDRNGNGGYFNGDTTTTPQGTNYVFTALKLDTNFNIIWKKQPAVQTVNPAFTAMLNYPSDDYLYMSYQNRGTVQWDSITLYNATNTLNLAGVRLSTATGDVVDAWKFDGNHTSKDEFDFIRTDANGNGYYAGMFGNKIVVANDSVYANGTSTSPDNFIIKWGLPCTDTLNSVDAPAAPAQLVATAVSTTGVQVTWGGVPGNHYGFNLYRSPDGISNWQIITATTHNVYNYSDQGLNPGTTYWYKVAAYTSTGGEGTFSNTDSATTFTGNCSAAIAQITAGTNHTFTVAVSGSGPYSYVWSNNGTAFSTNDTAVLTITASGTYNICVSVTDAGNCVATDCETVVLTGVAEAAIENIGIYPNPVGSQMYLSIETGNDAALEIGIYDYTGRQVLAIQRYANSGRNVYSLNTAGLTNGLYQVVVKSGNNKWSTRMVKSE